MNGAQLRTLKPDRIYTEQEAAELCGVSRDILRAARQAGDLEYSRFGACRIGYLGSDVIEWGKRRAQAELEEMGRSKSKRSARPRRRGGKKSTKKKTVKRKASTRKATTKKKRG